MQSSTRSSGLTRILSTALVFSAGVLASNRVKHFIGTRDASESVPPVAVAYSSEGAFIDGQRYAGGRLGGPRCDWDSLTMSDRQTYASTVLESDPGAFMAHVRSLPSQRKEQFVYTTLVQLARERGTTPGKQAEEIERAVGWKWNLLYSPSQE
jgi:hypothetical protein